MSPDPTLPYALLAFGRDVAFGRLDDLDPAAVNEAIRGAVLSTYFFNPRRDAIVAELSSGATSYRDSAEYYLRERSPVPPWGGSIPRQEWIARRGQVPRADAFRAATGYWGNVVWRPVHGGFWTSTKVAESNPWRRLLAPNDEIWVLEVDSELNLRVFEIEHADDWHQLVATYPLKAETAPVIVNSKVRLPSSAFYLPDWVRVANDWDAVHFTLEGKLRTLGVVAPVRDGFTLVHGEEAFDETLWLRWGFGEVRPQALKPEGATG